MTLSSRTRFQEPSWSPCAEVRCPHSKELALEQFDLSQEKRDDFLPRLDKTLSLQALGSPWPLGAEAQVGCQEDAPSTKVSPLCPRCGATSPRSCVLQRNCLNTSTRRHNYPLSDCFLLESGHCSRPLGYFWISSNIVSPTEGGVFFVQIFLCNSQPWLFIVLALFTGNQVTPVGRLRTGG